MSASDPGNAAANPGRATPSSSAPTRWSAGGLTVALVGPDGAGKTAVARRLPSRLPFATTYIYMGVATTSSSHLLPTTRLRASARHRLKGAAGRPRGTGVRLLRHAGRSLLGAAKLANRVAEEWYRQAIVWRQRRRGRVVIMDRHFLVDFYMSDVVDPGASLRRRIHGWMLRTLYPRPDLVLYLDAPPEVLLARKGEGTLASLERLRAGYRHVGGLLPQFEEVDAMRPLDEVVDEVASRIEALVRVRG